MSLDAVHQKNQIVPRLQREYDGQIRWQHTINILEKFIPHGAQEYVEKWGQINKTAETNGPDDIFLVR